MSSRAEVTVQAVGRALFRPEVPLIALVAAGFGYRLWRAWEEIPAVVLKITADDAYYYFQIARNITDGRNVTFDGETLTNGFHPLWIALLTPVYFITDDANVAVHLGLTIGALIGAATIVLIYLVGRELTNNGWAALVGAAFFALHPYIVVESVNGMETAVTLFTMGLTVWLFLRLVRIEAPHLSAFAMLGGAGGLMVLARTDSIFVLAAIGLFILVRDLRKGAWAGPALTAAVALLVVSPWLIWNLTNFGTIVQVSGVAVPEYNREVFLFWNGDSLSTQFERSWEVTKDALFDDLVHLYFVFPFTDGRTPFLLASAGLLLFLLAAPFSPQRNRVRGQIGLLAVPALGVLLMLLFHSAVRWHLREWYYGPVTIIACAFITVALAYFQSLLSGTKLSWHEAAERSVLRFTGDYRWVPVVALYGVVAAILFGVYGPSQSERWVERRGLPHRVNMLEGAYWLRDNTADDARISAFNAGILGYFSERDIINLDGVVNADAYHARLDCNTSGYMAEMRVEYVADVEMADGFARIDSMGVLPCGDEPCLTFQELAKVGRRLEYFGGGQVDMLKVSGANGARCRGT